MTHSNKRKYVFLRKIGRSIKQLDFCSEENIRKTRTFTNSFTKKYPVRSFETDVFNKKYTLTPKEKLYFLDKELHNLRTSVISNTGESAGRFTREQIFFLCLYKSKRDELMNSQLY